MRSSARTITPRCARARAPAVEDWSLSRAPTPRKTGTFLLPDVPLDQIIPYIDWNPFFQVWQLRGKYPNRGYPKIFNDQDVGPDAKRVFNDAQAMLSNIVGKKLLTARAILGIYPSNSVGDDIEVYADEDRTEVLATFRGLRQQTERDADLADSISPDAYHCLSDFVAPRDTGLTDHVGVFVTCAGFGLDQYAASLRKAGDDYGAIMADALADRLAEALAEWLHAEVRRKIWGYAPEEDLSPEDMHRCRYSGIRPACGYPTQPDHREKLALWSLLAKQLPTARVLDGTADQDLGLAAGSPLADFPDAATAGVTLTDSLAMVPTAAVSGLYMAAPHAQYFAVGKLARDQLEDYSARRGDVDGLADSERWLNSNLGYQP
ncbi:hypothetical protein H696_01320 [Fonticula alba]|uniref:AdoMet activation domain-containing protein n=1 Tax=Fonticula alba TaxID=691883 RepID=A0A058ZBV8_FONAL|nr:hypothetical protein H696_01320 [Fonticula alba]KCV71910.1 hypothetical protein H696_01320 [Fonticula alba]|eukprot:XP_009493488.1 hypothetical protein H696_01320 [Fonticula alba]